MPISKIGTVIKFIVIRISAVQTFLCNFGRDRARTNQTERAPRTKRTRQDQERHLGLARQPFHPDILTGVVTIKTSAHYLRHVIPDKRRECQHCHAVLLYGESINFCCFGGKVSLPSIAPDPPFLHNLLMRTAQESSTFFEHIRALNSSLAFASLGADVNESLAKSHKGIYTFQCHGTVYHNIGPLHPDDGDVPKFAQIYLYDGNETNREQQQIEHRIRHNKQLDSLICRSILQGISPIKFA